MKQRKLRSIPRYLVVFSLLIFTAFGVLFYCLTDTLSQKRSLEYFEGMSSKAEQSVSSYLVELQKMAKLVSYSENVQNFLFESTPHLRLDSQSAATDLITNVLSFYPDICEVAFLKKDGGLFQMRGEYDRLLRTAAEEVGEMSWERGEYFFSKVLYDTSSPFNSQTPYFFLAYPVYSLVKGEFSVEPGAICLIFAKTDDLAERYMEGFDLSDVTIALIEDNHTIFSNRPFSEQEEEAISKTSASEQKIFTGGKTYLALRNKIGDTPWNVVITAPENALSKDLIPIKIVIACFVIGEVILQIAILGVWTRQLSNPIEKLVDGIRCIDFKEKNMVRLSHVNVEELDLLVENINDMLNKIICAEKEREEMTGKLYDALLLKKQAQLQYYRSQINPHFLYNTLECISAIARISGITSIESICTSMADMFRYSSSDGTMVTLQQEIAHAENYFNVISQRAPGKYRLKIILPEGERETRIPKMILQPLLENCIKHGFEGKGKCCVILIQAARRNDGDLQVSVADNGFGIPPSKLAKLRKDLDRNIDMIASPSTDEENIGLFNICQRLNLTYSRKGSLKLDSQFGYYTIVKITIPANFDEESKDIQKAVRRHGCSEDVFGYDFRRRGVDCSRFGGDD